MATSPFAGQISVRAGGTRLSTQANISVKTLNRINETVVGASGYQGVRRRNTVPMVSATFSLNNDTRPFFHNVGRFGLDDNTVVKVDNMDDFNVINGYILHDAIVEGEIDIDTLEGEVTVNFSGSRITQIEG